MTNKLVEENNRLREEFDRFKIDLDAQHKVELACQKKNKERQYEQETQNTVAKLRQDLNNTQRFVTTPDQDIRGTSQSLEGGK